MFNPENFSTRSIVELTAAATMFGGLAALLYERIRNRRGIGIRVIQLATVVLVVPTILVLALEGILGAQTTAALIGAAVGYILSGIGKDEPPRNAP